MSKSSKPIPLAIPNALLELIDHAADATARTRAELMRLAIEIGIEDLRRIQYNIAGALVTQAHASVIHPTVVNMAMVAEDPTPYTEPPKQAKP